MHIKLVVYGWNHADTGQIVRSAEGGLNFYRANSPLKMTSEWYWSKKTLPPSVYPDLMVNEMGDLWIEMAPQSVVTIAIWRCTNVYQFTAWGWTHSPETTPQGCRTVFISLPYGYPPHPADGRSSWDPAYGEGFTDNFQACLVHEMAHAIKNMGLLTSPQVYDSITDIHDTNNQLVSRNPSAGSVEKTRYYLSQINARFYNLINNVPDTVRV